MIDIKKEEHAYLIGFLQGDGYHNASSRNRGKVVVEIKKDDENLIHKLVDIYTDIGVKSTISERTRDTNFTPEYSSISVSVFDFQFRQSIIEYIPVGKKSNDIEIPEGIHEIGYWRGMIDADGSVSITKKNIPFVSLVTSSDHIKNGFCTFLESNFGIRKCPTRNKRDDIYNIMVMRENAVSLCSILYGNSSIHLDRKHTSAHELMSWKRPDDMPSRKCTIPPKRWETWEDDFILAESIQDSVKKLGRTEKSIKTRIWRLSS